MMNLVSFETPPLGRKERANTTITAKAPPRANESNSSSTCFHSHLDLSLGISLSHGGSSCCDATGCSGIKASCGGRQGGGKQTSGIQQQTSVFNFIFFKCTCALPNMIALKFGFYMQFHFFENCHAVPFLLKLSCSSIIHNSNY